MKLTSWLTSKSKNKPSINVLMPFAGMKEDYVRMNTDTGGEDGMAACPTAPGGGMEYRTLLLLTTNYGRINTTECLPGDEPGCDNIPGKARSANICPECAGRGIRWQLYHLPERTAQ